MINVKCDLLAAWYTARIEYLEEELKKLPNVHYGNHRGIKVLRCYDSDMTKEISETDKDWKTYAEIADKAACIKSDILHLRKTFKYRWSATIEPLTPLVITNKKKKGFLTMDLWNSLVSDSNTYENSHNYEYDGHCFRSRIEMNVAQVADEMHLKYKYDCMMRLGDRTVSPDFVFAFPEFNCCVVLEIFGMMDKDSYLDDNMLKYRSYNLAGFREGRDFFVIGSDGGYLPNKDEIRAVLEHMIQEQAARFTVRD